MLTEVLFLFWSSTSEEIEKWMWTSRTIENNGLTLRVQFKSNIFKNPTRVYTRGTSFRCRIVECEWETDWNESFSILDAVKEKYYR